MEGELTLRSIVKTTLLILGGIVAITLLVSGVLYLYATHIWKKYYTQEQVKLYAAEINAAPAMQSLFYTIYDKLEHNSRHQTMQQVYIPGIAKELLGINNSIGRCWVTDAAIPFSFNSKPHRFRPQILGLGLQQYTTHEKCFDYRIQYEANEISRYFPMYGIDTSRPFYQLNDTTSILTYMVIADRPAYYRCRLDELAERVKSLRDQLK